MATQTPTTAVQKILYPYGVPAGSLEPLAAYFAATDPESKARAIGTLASAYALGVNPSLLPNVILAKTDLLGLYRYQYDPTWPYGTFDFRRQLCETLLNRARYQRVGAAEQSTEGARASLVLAGQDPMFCVPHMHWLVNQNDFMRLSRWPENALTAVKELLSSHVERTGIFYAAAIRAAIELEKVIASEPGQVNEETVDASLSELDGVSASAEDRPELQWRLINFAWRFAVLSRSKQQPSIGHRLAQSLDLWRQRHTEGCVARWIEEALSSDYTDIKTIGFNRAYRPAG